ncbi:MAG: hypothetical protein ACKODS_07965 [Methylophilaceae bacterium]
MPIFYSGQTGQEKIKSTFDFGTLDTVAYSTGDILTSTAIAVPNASRFAGDTGTLLKLILNESTSGTLQKPALRVWIFGGSLTPAARNAPQAFTTAQLNTYVGYIDIANASWINGGTGAAIVEASVSIPYGLQTVSTSLYLVPEVRAAYTFHSTGKITGTVILAID